MKQRFDPSQISLTVHTSGKASSAAGLTAAVVRDKAESLWLKQLADNFANATRMKDTKKALLEISGFSSLNDFREVFPGSFTEEGLDGLIGADVNKKPNNTGEMLQDYIKGLIEGKPEENGARAVFEEIDKDSFDFSSLSEYSCILINCSHIGTESLMQIQNMKSLKKLWSSNLIKSNYSRYFRDGSAAQVEAGQVKDEVAEKWRFCPSEGS